MANIKDSILELMGQDGAIGAAIVDSNSGMVLGKDGTGINLDVAAAGNTEVIRAKMKTMKALGLNDHIEDILITLGKHYHILRPISAHPGFFIYLALDNSRANLALARFKCAGVEKALTI